MTMTLEEMTRDRQGYVVAASPARASTISCTGYPVARAGDVVDGGHSIRAEVCSDWRCRQVCYNDAMTLNGKRRSAAVDDLTTRLETILATQPLVLLVNPALSRLTDISKTLQETGLWREYPVGKGLSSALIAGGTARLHRRIQTELHRQIGETEGGNLLLTGIDLLFEPAFELDPLALFRHLGRSRPLTVCWPGDFQADVLSYAVPEHAHYRTWSRPDLCSECIHRI